MKIRNIRKSDYAAIDKLLLQLHDVDVNGRPELFVKKEHYMPKDSFDHLIKNAEIGAILAEIRGEVGGCCFVSMLSCSGMVKMKTAYIDLLVVDERHRRQGIGKALFEAVAKRAEKHGAKRVDLMVWNHNQIAMDAYESYGMVRQRSVYEKKL